MSHTGLQLQDLASEYQPSSYQAGLPGVVGLVTVTWAVKTRLPGLAVLQGLSVLWIQLEAVWL